VTWTGLSSPLSNSEKEESVLLLLLLLLVVVVVVLPLVLLPLEGGRAVTKTLLTPVALEG
jgi:hypothetical protein